MPMPCRFPQEHRNELCLCPACHLSSELFPRRQDGRIILPGLPASRELVQGVFRLPPPVGPSQLPLVSSPPRAPSPNTAECGSRSHVRRTVESETSFGRFKNAVAGTDGPSEIPGFRMGPSTSNNRAQPRSHSQSYHTTTTTVPNPYPMPVDTSNPRPSGRSSLDQRAKASVPESTTSTSSPLASTSNLANKNSTTPALKFCPPFVASDRIVLPESSDAAKEGMTMIPWSARRRKQKYRSGFESGAGQGKSKTMFRYYGPDSCSS